MSKKKYTIGTIGLSYPIKDNLEAEKSTRDFIQKVESEGHQVVVGQTTFSKLGYKTASIGGRLDDLHRMFLDPKIDIILNNTGGYSSNELLEFIDYDVIKSNPKVFVGYSDITAINLAIYAKTGLQTINGHCLDDFEIDSDFFGKITSILNNDEIQLRNHSTYQDTLAQKDFTTPIIACLEEKTQAAEGKVVVGNLSTFNLLLGTPFLPDFKDKILFIEYDKEEVLGLPSLERMLWQIRQNGIFDKITGLVFGLLEPEVQKEENNIWNIKTILENVTQGFDFPVLYNAQFGHIYPSWVLQNGRKVKIDKAQIYLK